MALDANAGGLDSTNLTSADQSAGDQGHLSQSSWDDMSHYIEANGGAKGGTATIEKNSCDTEDVLYYNFTPEHNLYGAVDEAFDKALSKGAKTYESLKDSAGEMKDSLSKVSENPEFAVASLDVTKTAGSINRDVEPEEHTVKKDETLTKIAKEQLGAGATPEEVQKHIKTITELNDIKDPNKLKVGDKLLLPGYTADGGFSMKDSSGDKTTIWADGKERTERADGTGQVVNPDGTEHHWGPNAQDNYDIIGDGGKQTVDADGTKHTVWSDKTERVEKADGSGYVHKPGLDKDGKPDGSYSEHHWGPKEGDNYDLKRNTDGSFERTDKTSDGHKDLPAERARLDEKAKEKLSPAEYEKFKKDMQDFETRAQKDKVSTEDVAKTYGEVSRILEKTGDTPLNQTERNKVAKELMHNAADPKSIDQGFHNTCNVSTVESRLYTKSPAEAAKMVADVSTTGKFTTADGTVVEVPAGSLKPDSEGVKDPVPDGQRNYASQIFQVTAVNIHYARQGDGIKYEQRTPDPAVSKDTGERLVDYSENPPEVLDKNSFVYKAFFGGDPKRSPGLSNDEIIEVSNQISGKNEKDVMLEKDTWGPNGDKTTKVDSEKELTTKLAELKRDGKLPIIVYVDAANEPFLTDSGAGTAGGSGAAHVVTITDYDETTGKVSIDNQWGKRVDHDGASGISVHDLYLAMDKSTASDTKNQWQKDVDYNREHGQIDGCKELELARLKHNDSDISDSKYDKEITRIMRENNARWAEQTRNGTLDPNEQARAQAKYNQLLALIGQKDPARVTAIQQGVAAA